MILLFAVNTNNTYKTVWSFYWFWYQLSFSLLQIKWGNEGHWWSSYSTVSLLNRFGTTNLDSASCWIKFVDTKTMFSFSGWTERPWGGMSIFWILQWIDSSDYQIPPDLPFSEVRMCMTLFEKLGGSYLYVIRNSIWTPFYLMWDLQWKISKNYNSVLFLYS